MKKIITILLLFFYSFSLFAVPFCDTIFVEMTVKGMSIFADRKWKFTEDTFIVRDPNQKTQTVYPYEYDFQFIYLGEPISVDSGIGVYPYRTIAYDYDDHKLTLVFEDDTVLKLVDQDYKNSIVNIISTSALAIAGGIGIGKQIFKAIVGNKTLATATSLGLSSNQTVNSDNGMVFKTDKLGRPSSASGKVQLNSGSRDKNITRKVGNVLNKKSDDGGHLIGDALGGPSETYNLVPMESSLNRGAYAQFEKSLKNYAEQGKEVYVNVVPKYDNDGFRPSAIEYNYSIDGIQMPPKYFLNE